MGTDIIGGGRQIRGNELTEEGTDIIGGDRHNRRGQTYSGTPAKHPPDSF